MEDIHGVEQETGTNGSTGPASQTDPDGLITIVWLTILASAMACVFMCDMSAWILRCEAWEAEGLYYLDALLVTGIVAGFIMPGPYWAHYAGAVLGQLGYILLATKVNFVNFLLDIWGLFGVR
jgi:hypothetical protein